MTNTPPTPHRVLEDRVGDLPEVEVHKNTPGQSTHGRVRYFFIGTVVDGTLGALWAALDGSEAAGFVRADSPAARRYAFTWRMRVVEGQAAGPGEWSALGFLNYWWEADMGAYLRHGLYEADDLDALRAMVAARRTL